MRSYKLSNLAKRDLMDIVLYGDKIFGIEQSNRYRDRLKQRFLMLVEQPMLYPAVHHIIVGYRRSVCGKHSIYYRVKDNSIEIMRILGQQDYAQALKNPR